MALAPCGQTQHDDAAATSGFNVAGRLECNVKAVPFMQEPRTATTAIRATEATVYLVGAGPGDPDLLTVKALRLIGSADVVLHDDLVPQAIIKLASPAAEIVNVGKRCGVKCVTQEEINAWMVLHALRNRSVVRLKSGDPLLFGRAAEEMAALAEAGVAFEIVPGITSGFAAAAALGCSLTDRNGASSVVITTGHHAQSHVVSRQLQLEDATRIVYMPGRDLHQQAEEWLRQGLPPELPCAIVSHTGQPSEKIQCMTLAELGKAEPAPAPSLLLAGWAVGNAGTDSTVALREATQKMPAQEQRAEGQEVCLV
jgi:uroporphyrin-III C-methyltransferase